jgi:hypothetical protein
MRAAEAVEAGYDEIQHANMLFLNFLARPEDDTRSPARFTRVAEGAAAMDLGAPEVRSFLELLARKHTVLDPTLATFEDMFGNDPTDPLRTLEPYFGRLPAQVERAARGGGLPADAARRELYRRSYSKMGELVLRASKRGIPIVAGTDDVAGLSLSRELEQYVAAGLPAAEVLAIATIGAARVARVADRSGSIAAGKRADLVLLDGDPLVDIGAVRATSLVIVRGVVLDPVALWQAVGMRPRSAR